MARFFDAAEVKRLLPMDRCIETVADALSGYSAGKAVMPVRTMIKLPLDPPEKVGILSTMPCYLGDYCACKTITVFPANSGTALNSHQGAVLLFSVEDGQLLSITDGCARAPVPSMMFSFGVRNKSKVIVRNQANTIVLDDQVDSRHLWTRNDRRRRHELTLLRTAAASALATRLLSNDPVGGSVLALLGTGLLVSQGDLSGGPLGLTNT